MDRSERLLLMLQVLRGSRRPVTAAGLASRFMISERSVYRDVASLNRQGARIEGSPGVGFVLRRDGFLPPLAFDPQEAGALTLGLRFVARRGPPALVEAAESALAKLAAVQPVAFHPRARLEQPYVVGPAHARTSELWTALHDALRTHRILRFGYADAAGRRTVRRVWPVAIGWFDACETLAAWCELRQAFRHFRLDRIEHVEVLPEAPARSRQSLLSELRRLEPGIQW